MSINKNIYLAIDTAHEKGLVALFSCEKIIFEAVMDKKMEHAQRVVSLINEAAIRANDEGYEVQGLLTGIGPGSFVGIRIAIATAMGYCLGRSLALMGLCSHKMLAYSYELSESVIYVLMKANGNLYYLSAFDNKQRQITELFNKKTVTIDEFLALACPDAALITDNENIQGHRALKTVLITKGPNAVGLKRLSLEKIEQAGQLIDESESLLPQYVSEPNVKKPENLCQIVNKKTSLHTLL